MEEAKKLVKSLGHCGGCENEEICDNCMSVVRKISRALRKAHKCGTRTHQQL